MLNIIYTHNWLQEKTKCTFAKASITPQQYNILRILRGANTALSTMQIRERMLDKMSDTSRLADRLLAKGLVTKNTCPADKRLVDICITNNGLKLLDSLEDAVQQNEKHLKNLNAADIDLLNNLLDKLRG